MIAISIAVCMIFRGCGCMWNCVMPIGRQFASGLSLLLDAIRCFLSSTAQGVNGRPPGTLAPMLKKVATGGELGSRGNGATGGSISTSPAPRVPRPPRPDTGWRSARSQLPERSGFPSGVRGVGASMSTRPCASRGTPGAGYFGHCAGSETEHAVTIMAAPEIAPLTWTLRFLLPLFLGLRCIVFLCAGAGEDVPQCIISFMARVFENWSRSPDNRNFHDPWLGEGLQLVHSGLIEKRVRIEPAEALRELHVRAGAPERVLV